MKRGNLLKRNVAHVKHVLLLEPDTDLLKCVLIFSGGPLVVTCGVNQ